MLRIVFKRVLCFLCYRVPMYSEAKLAFIIYLWYPKTMVMVTFFYQKSLNWMFSVCKIESATASSVFSFSFFPESGLLCSREPRTCITRSWDLSLPDTNQTLIATLMNWGPELVTWPFSGGSEDQFMLKPASLSSYSMLRHSLTDPNNLPFHLLLWHPIQIWPLLNALLLKVLQRVPHRCVFLLLSAPRLANSVSELSQKPFGWCFGVPICLHFSVSISVSYVKWCLVLILVCALMYVGLMWSLFLFGHLHLNGIWQNL